MTTGTPPTPNAFDGLLVHTAVWMVNHAEKAGHTPQRFDILFTEGAVEALAAAGATRRVFGITTLVGVPVTYPERPSLGPDRALRLDLVTDRGGGNQWVTVEALIDHALPGVTIGDSGDDDENR